MGITFEAYFRDATGVSPHAWQALVARDGLPEVLAVPSGLGKTEGAVLGWAWRLLVDPGEPARLIYCLPTRTLVAQTVTRLRDCFCRLRPKYLELNIQVYQLTGGAIESDWAGDNPPHGRDLDGPLLEPAKEGCPVSFVRVQKVLESGKAKAWLWNDEADRWARVNHWEIRLGMLVMLKRDVGGYDESEGWTGDRSDVLAEVPRAGRGATLRDDAWTEVGYWSKLEDDLKDARREAVRRALADGRHAKGRRREAPYRCDCGRQIARHRGIARDPRTGRCTWQAEGARTKSGCAGTRS